MSHLFIKCFWTEEMGILKITADFFFFSVNRTLKTGKQFYFKRLNTKSVKYGTHIHNKNDLMYTHV